MVRKPSKSRVFLAACSGLFVTDGHLGRASPVFDRYVAACGGDLVHSHETSERQRNARRHRR
jgi:hypothetical protein